MVDFFRADTRLIVRRWIEDFQFYPRCGGLPVGDVSFCVGWIS
jgi:hypothetical protein